MKKLFLALIILLSLFAFTGCPTNEDLAIDYIYTVNIKINVENKSNNQAELNLIPVLLDEENTWAEFFWVSDGETHSVIKENKIVNENESTEILLKSSYEVPVKESFLLNINGENGKNFLGYNKEVPLYNKGQKQDLSNIIQDNLGTVIFKHDDFSKWTDTDGEKQLDNYTVYAEYNLVITDDGCTLNLSYLK